MAKLKKYDLDGKEIGEVEFSDKLLEVTIKPQQVKDYIVALLANKRQWSANTKGRSEIAHSNSKPHAQKGTGRARQGTIKAAQYKGGATVFGPKPKFKQRVRRNRKEKQRVISSLLAQKLTAGHASFLQLSEMEAPRTQTLAAFLRHIGYAGKKVLFLSDSQVETQKKREMVYLSLRNVPKVSFAPAASVSGYDLMKSDVLLIAEGASSQIEEILKR